MSTFIASHRPSAAPSLPKFDFEELEQSREQIPRLWGPSDCDAGTCGKSYLARVSNTPVVIKVYDTAVPESGYFAEHVKRFAGVKHPHLVPIFGFCPMPACLVVEHVAGGNVGTKLEVLTWQ